MKFPPASAYASSTANDSRSPAVQPKTLPPRQSGKTSRSVLRMRFMKSVLLGKASSSPLRKRRSYDHESAVAVRKPLAENRERADG